MARLRRLLLPLAGVVLAVGALSLAVIPGRTWLGQRDDISAAEAQIAELDGRIEGLEARLAALDTPGEVERIARERFDLVMPGEEAYGILPAPEPTWPIPAGWPFTATR